MNEQSLPKKKEKRKKKKKNSLTLDDMHSHNYTWQCVRSISVVMKYTVDER